MTQGRKPTPVALKLHTGNPGKRPINLHTFEPDSVLPECPAHLTGEARAEFDRLATELHKYHMIALVDVGQLAMICTQWGRYVEAEKMIEAAEKEGKSGLFSETPNGYLVQSPWLQVSNKAMEQYRQFCADYGMNPASRVRVVPQTTQLGLPGFEDEKPRLASQIR